MARTPKMTNLHKVKTNTLTQAKIVLPKPIDEEINIYDDSLLITETDSHGVITYANRRFCKVSGYEKETLIGMSHALTRHPDMPVGLFHAMWDIIMSKKIWRGYIKSLAKDGRYYWTLMYVQARLNEKNEIIGFTATRKKAYKSSLIEVESKYKELQGKENIGNDYFMRALLYHGDALATRG